MHLGLLPVLGSSALRHWHRHLASAKQYSALLGSLYKPQGYDASPEMEKRLTPSTPLGLG
ncbi:hypothetical protein IF2G_04973 [Cordyceps javanica]|nr:hypothetical protein IF2G_04973 [Cordyceps javanica]